MSDPIQVHRLRVVAEVMRPNHFIDPVFHSDLNWLLYAYTEMIEILEHIEKTSQSLSDTTLATNCLNRVRS